jgi:hypothetical protein
MLHENPYEAPRSDPRADLGPEPWSGPGPGFRRYRGIGRRLYAAMVASTTIVLGTLSAAIAEGIDRGELSEDLGVAFPGIAGAELALIATLSAMRIRNLGGSAWWGLTALIPFYNLIVFVRCVAYPAGWLDHRTLDTAGRVVGGLIAGFAVLVILVIAAALGRAMWILSGG